MASLMLDFMKWKVLHACIGEDNFLGFNRKPHGKLDGQAQGFCLSSDWPDLNNLCRRTGTELKWTSHLNPERSLIVEDPSGVVEARLHHKSIIHLLQPRTSRHTLLSIQSPKYEYCSILRLQGNLAKLPCMEHSVYTFYSNATISEDILIVCIKAHLQVLPTK